MADKPTMLSRAEERFEQAKTASGIQHDKEVKARTMKTARLKALRLAKEEADRAETPNAKASSSSK